MRNKLTTILLVLAFFAGLSLLLYPTVSDYWNSLHASQAVADYAENVRNLEAEKYEQVLQDARNYNQMLPYKHTTFALSEEDKVAYDTLLDISGTGVMGYIEIPTINISLPVYHGTEDAVLQIAVGHLEWSSLPVGGEDTHCVLSGHRGLPSAKLFTNLDKLVVGDKFVMRVLDEVLTYEVDQILIVEPTDVSTLIIEAGKDLCTLVTCTPYGINSHRLLVRGHRIENQEEAQAIRVTSDAIQIEPLIVAPAVALPMLLVLLMILLVSGGKTKSAGGKKNAKTE
ncbi:class C sortase [Pseudoflavonifractor phocaeensis]|uniref:class C sortase n=1 Tax=Pseudoflavonifractor phocaeensis TaxID=1870988 RepID=UPI00210DB6BF|nr:class C sortase [Pseudoflavonifractor phocaeensis]MCQ4863207.1 class C sortase [Pseudoflavonifractor phocaeensis]